MEGAHGTNRRASGMLTVHAQPAHEFVVLGQNDGVFMFRLHRLGGYSVVVPQLVLLRAASFTLFATDAHGCVIQQRFTHGKLLLVAPKQDFRSSGMKYGGMKYEGNVCGDEADLETFLETMHNTRAGPKAKEEPGPATFAPGPRRAVP